MEISEATAPPAGRRAAETVTVDNALALYGREVAPAHAGSRLLLEKPRQHECRGES